MGSSKSKTRIVNDNIHGEIELNQDEWNVVNTATFQRLRSLKQLGMGHLVYPNATHTRFAHSLGVFRVMCRVLTKIGDGWEETDKADLRLAALLHDIGHYPYSHLMEYVDNVQLLEEQNLSSEAGIISGNFVPYPNHEELGRTIIQEQPDIRDAIGGSERAIRIGNLFSRKQEADQQLSKLIHSSLDMDRLDYLLRDARACGVVYGEIDLDYLLNNIKASGTGTLGVKRKALAAAEHFLLARVFMYRSVYYHKTTYGLEEACRQLLWRLRQRNDFDQAVPSDGGMISEIACGQALVDFTDVYVDRIVHRAYRDPGDAVIKALSTCLVERRPPRCLVDIGELFPRKPGSTKANLFRERCRDRLPSLAKDYGLDLGQFLLCGPKPIKFEERKSNFSRSELKDLMPEEREELIKIFDGSGDEPVSIVDVEGSLMSRLCNDEFGIQRLYLADHSLSEEQIVQISGKIVKWVDAPK